MQIDRLARKQTTIEFLVSIFAACCWVVVGSIAIYHLPSSAGSPALFVATLSAVVLFSGLLYTQLVFDIFLESDVSATDGELHVSSSKGKALINATRVLSAHYWPGYRLLPARVVIIASTSSGKNIRLRIRPSDEFRSGRMQSTLGHNIGVLVGRKGSA